MISKTQLVAEGLEPELREILAELDVRDAADLTLDDLLRQLRDHNKTACAAVLADRIRNEPDLALRVPEAFRMAIEQLPGLEVMDSPLTLTLAELTDIQREAVMWDESPAARAGGARLRQDTCAHLPNCPSTGLVS